MDELQTNCYNMIKNIEFYVINKKPHKLSALCIDECFQNKSKYEERVDRNADEGCLDSSFDSKVKPVCFQRYNDVKQPLDWRLRPK